MHVSWPPQIGRERVRIRGHANGGGLVRRTDPRGHTKARRGEVEDMIARGQELADEIEGSFLRQLMR